MTKIFSLFLGCLMFSQLLSAQACVKPWCYEQPEPFEKFYVCPESVFHDCDGTYFINEFHCREKVRAVMKDCKGTFVLRIWTQCPYCGTCYRGKHPPEGMSCPLILE